MPRYVDADELWLQIDKQESFEQGRNRAYYKGLRDAKNILNEQPTANVVEPKKGRWMRRDSSLFRCSECGRFSPTKENFCPTCGADMREEKEDEKTISKS